MSIYVERTEWYTCDRCERNSERKGSVEATGWLDITAQTVGLLYPPVKRHLCRDCRTAFESFLEWGPE